MNLKDYITAQHGNATRLAKELEIPLSYLSQMSTGERAVSPEKAFSISKLTDGAVTRQELRPTDFWKIWPDLEHLKPADELA